MNRIYGIAVAVVGLIITALSAVRVLPLLSTGSALIFLGLLLFGLSFIPLPASDDTPRMSTPETLGGIFYAPGEVFRNLRKHPRWLIVLLIGAILSAIYFNAFIQRLTPEKVTNYTIDKTLQSSFVANNEDARKAIESGRPKALEEAKNPVARVGKAVNGFVGSVFLTAFLALIFWVFAKAMGGSMNYWQGFAATAYAMFPVTVLRNVLSLIILFIKDPDDIHPIIGQGSLVQDNLSFLVTPAANPVIYVLLASLSLLSFYWIWLNATGLKNTGDKVTPTIAWSATMTIWLIGLVLGVVSAIVFGSFMS